MGYTITFSDVMTVVISGALTIIVWFLKSYLSNIQATNEIGRASCRERV